MTPAITVRPGTVEEVGKYFYQWPLQEQWNPGLDAYDLLRVYYKSDSEGFFVGTIADESNNEQIVSIVSSVRYGRDSGWVGYYIVAPEYRGRGYGLATFQRALDHMNQRASVGLDAVLAQVDNYKKSGFTIVSWENQRRSGNIEHIHNKLSSNENRDFTIVNASAAPLDQMNALERRYNGWDRSIFVENWVNLHSNSVEHGRFAFVAMKNGRAIGYGSVRPAITSFRVGPLYAESLEVAQGILYQLAKSVSHVMSKANKIPSNVKAVFDVDICAANPQAVALFNELDMPDTFPTLRMWRGKQPDVDVSGVYGVTSLELG